MKKIKEFKNHLSLFFAILTLFLSFTSCTNNDDQQEFRIDKNLKKKVKDYTSEEIFRAIFFLQGDLVNHVPSLYNLKVNSEIFKENVIYVASLETNMPKERIDKLDKFDALSDSLMSEIKILNPKIFDELKASIESKKPDNVVEKLKECSLLIQSASYKVYEFKEGLSVLELAEAKGNISPKNYEFEKVSEVQRFNKDLQNFIDGEPDLYNYHTENVALGVVVLLLVTVVIFLAYVILATVAIFGEIVIFYFNFIFIHNWVIPLERDPKDGLQGGQIVRDLILIKG